MTYNIESTLTRVCKAFRIPGEIVEWRPLTSGNINTTYYVACQEASEKKDYLVQCVNSYVFKHPERVMHNIELVTEHIRRKNALHGISGRRTRLHFHHTAEGRNFYVINEGEFWRLSNFIEDSVSFDTADDSKVLQMAGKAFGQFARQLTDFDAGQLFETIPHFHDTRQRLETFFAHVEEDPCGRSAEVQEEIAQIRDAREFACKLNEMVDRGELPLRVTHNDTKTNNVLFDKETLEPLVVIDLDTVMPGLVAHDFGDAIRFAANTAAEDEADLSKVSLDLELFRAFAEGYISAAGDLLTQTERRSLALGAVTITLEQATRFLDDYITGDQYFKTLYQRHNLVRARCQLALFQDMMSKFDEMNDIVEKCVTREKFGL